MPKTYTVAYRKTLTFVVLVEVEASSPEEAQTLVQDSPEEMRKINAPGIDGWFVFSGSKPELSDVYES